MPRNLPPLPEIPWQEQYLQAQADEAQARNRSRKMERYDETPPAVRQALLESPFDIRVTWNMGMSEKKVIEMIRGCQSLEDAVEVTRILDRRPGRRVLARWYFE